jgi:hypothetical protein
VYCLLETSRRDGEAPDVERKCCHRTFPSGQHRDCRKPLSPKRRLSWV